MERAGVPAGELYQFDGSGLSNLNRASANALVRALVYAHNRSYSDIFHGSLAVAADPSGSMSRMFRNSAAARNLHAKTGFISRSRTLSGYVQARSGELIAFSFLYNGANTNAARAAQQELGILLAEFGG
jgi:D-alanyl-D-alanine carboxypeptidase/D-alanyl-D-alanine-endopeptidase (penicillin-binding protein 4)